MKSRPLIRPCCASAMSGGSTTMPRWLTLPVCISSRTRPCPATLLAKAASLDGAVMLVPMMAQGPPPLAASAAALRAQGSGLASNAQARKSRTQSFSFAATAAPTSRPRLATIASAMRWASAALGSGSGFAQRERRGTGHVDLPGEFSFARRRPIASGHRELALAAHGVLNLVTDEARDETGRDAHRALRRGRQ